MATYGTYFGDGLYQIPEVELNHLEMLHRSETYGIYHHMVFSLADPQGQLYSESAVKDHCEMMESLNWSAGVLLPNSDTITEDQIASVSYLATLPAISHIYGGHEVHQFRNYDERNEVMGWFNQYLGLPVRTSFNPEAPLHRLHQAHTAGGYWRDYALWQEADNFMAHFGVGTLEYYSEKSAIQNNYVRMRSIVDLYSPETAIAVSLNVTDPIHIHKTREALRGLQAVQFVYLRSIDEFGKRAPITEDMLTALGQAA